MPSPGYTCRVHNEAAHTMNMMRVVVVVERILASLRIVRKSRYYIDIAYDRDTQIFVQLRYSTKERPTIKHFYHTATMTARCAHSKARLQGSDQIGRSLTLHSVTYSYSPGQSIISSALVWTAMNLLTATRKTQADCSVLLVDYFCYRTPRHQHCRILIWTSPSSLLGILSSYFNACQGEQ